MVGPCRHVRIEQNTFVVIIQFDCLIQGAVMARWRVSLSFHPSPEELKRQSAALEETRVELDSVQNQLVLARSEIETIKAVATVSENTKQEAIDQIRSQWQEEVASLQAIMKGKHELRFEVRIVEGQSGKIPSRPVKHT